MLVSCSLFCWCKQIKFSYWKIKWYLILSYLILPWIFNNLFYIELVVHSLGDTELFIEKYAIWFLRNTQNTLGYNFYRKKQIDKRNFYMWFFLKINLSFANECACESVCVPGCRGGFRTGQASRAGSAGGGWAWGECGCYVTLNKKSRQINTIW